MQLRDLEKKDAPLMLEWMHDKTVVEYLRGNFESKTLQDCYEFIESSQSKNDNIHLAIVNDEDHYMGTVSLKNIDRNNNSAEFAITVRISAMGKGYSWYAIDSILKKAFNEYGLEVVYWCVSRNNIRAIRFYDKHHFSETIEIPKEALDRYREIDDLKWYSVLKDYIS